MRTFAIQLILTLLAAGICQLFFPWWGLAVVAGIIAFLVRQKYLYSSYLAGFAALFLLWCVYALWIYSGANGQLLPDKVGLLLGGLNGWTMAAVAGLIAGILGGFGALTGALGRNLFD